MRSEEPQDPRKKGRSPDKLDEITNLAWSLVKQWEAEPGTTANDKASVFLHVKKALRSHAKRHTPGATSKAFARLSVGAQRETFHASLGMRLTRSPELEGIAERIGPDVWNESFVPTLAHLPFEFANRIKKPAELVANRERLIRVCENAARLIESLSLDPQTDVLASPFYGLLAKQVLTIEWYWALHALRRDTMGPADRGTIQIASNALYGLLMTDPARALVRLLRGYSAALKQWEPERELQGLLFFANGKLSKKEFVKRVVFFLLDQSLKSRRAPNKETALVANMILGLRGKAAITANDITQMNKKTRRNYHKDKDIEQTIKWIKG
jgi:hypothetical protein